MNSYQRLKKKNQELEQQHRELFQKFYNYLKNPDSYENQMIAAEIQQQGRLAEMWTMGQRNGYTFLGLLEQISKSDNNNTFNWNINDRNNI